tara:strand:+ start:1383 stop:1658 length:276 start_codon:yes stop_codon:yes gene_type:complete
MIPNYHRIELAIIKKLFHYGCWGKGHLLIIRLKKGIPREDLQYVGKVLRELNKKEIVLVKKTKHGDAVFLNKMKRKDIYEIISKNVQYWSK